MSMMYFLITQFSGACISARPTSSRMRVPSYDATYDSICSPLVVLGGGKLVDSDEQHDRCHVYMVAIASFPLRGTNMYGRVFLTVDIGGCALAPHGGMAIEKTYPSPHPTLSSWSSSPPGHDRRVLPQPLFGAAAYVRSCHRQLMYTYCARWHYACNSFSCAGRGRFLGSSLYN